MGRCPPALGRLTGLNGLYLGTTIRLDLRGPIPEAWSNLSNLSRLWLSRANVTGRLPIWLENLPALRLLDLSDNWGMSGTAAVKPEPVASRRDRHLCNHRLRTTAAWLPWLETVEFSGVICGAEPDAIDVAVFYTPDAAQGASGGIETVNRSLDRRDQPGLPRERRPPPVSPWWPEKLVDYEETGEHDDYMRAFR